LFEIAGQTNITFNINNVHGNLVDGIGPSLITTVSQVENQATLCSDEWKALWGF
jgi:hypothetical protein